MKKSLLALVSLILVCPQLSLGAAASASQGSGPPALIVNGVAYGPVISWRGADLRATVAIIDSASASPKKHVTDVTIDPLVVEVPLPLQAPLAGVVEAFCNNQPASALLVPYRLGVGGQNPATVLECYGSTLIEVKFPELDAVSKAQGKVALTFAPERVRMIPFPAATPAPTTKAKVATSFSLEISGISSSPVIRIGEFVISRKLAPSSTATTGPSPQPPATVSNLVVTLPASASEWTAWRDDFLVNGKSLDASERTAMLTFSENTSPLYSLQLSHVGLAHFVNRPTDAGTTQLEVELYLERVTPVTAGTAPSGTTASSTSTTPAATTTATPTTTPAATSTTTPTTSPAPKEPAPTAAAEPLPAATTDRMGPERKPVATTTDKPADIAAKPESGKFRIKDTVTPPVPEKTSTTPAEKKTATTGTRFAAVHNAGDKGARDPEGLPRPEGSVRKTFSGNKGKDYSQENATYTSTQSSDELSEFYNKALTGDGWEEYRHDENNFGVENAHQIIMTYTKAKDRLVVTLTDTKPGEVDINIRLDRTF